MSKLLTDEQLKEEIGRIVDSSEYNPDNPNPVWIGNTIFDLIQSQKQAHADMVIGEDEGAFEKRNGEVVGGMYTDIEGYRNRLRAEQRERNTS